MTHRTMIIAAAAMMSMGVATAGEYGPGVSDTEIKIGQTMPYSGPASAYGTIGRIEEAYFNMINSKGGVNGRKIRMISLDDAYSPPKTVEQTRKLVEQEEVLAIVGTVGTPTNSATQRYLNAKKVPQIFLSTGAAKWDDPKNFPYTTALYPPYQMEGQIFAKYILKNKPDAKLGVFSQNDDAGKDYVRGLKEGLGDKAAQIIVKEVTYETSDPTVDSQIIALQGSGADVLLTAAIPKFTTLAIRKVYDVGWRATQFINSVSTSVGSVMKPAGLEKGVGIISAAYTKDPTDPQWQDTPEFKEWLAWMQKYIPSGSLGDPFYVDGYIRAKAMIALLKASGDNLTRENIMKQAASIHDMKLPMLLPGINVSTSADDYQPIKQMQLQKFDGTTWKLFGEVISGSGS